LCIKQRSERKQSLHRNFREGCLAQSATDYRIEHPGRDRYPGFVFEFYDERFITLSSQSANNVDPLAKVRVMSIVNLMGRRFMSSVGMPVGTALPVIC
jgi:hypothetical protein